MYQRLIRTCAPEITRSLNCRVFCQDTQEFARSNLAHRFGLTPSLTMPKRKTIINFTFNGEIRQIIPDFQKLNLEHKYDIDIGMTALAGFICIHGFKKRAKEGETHPNQVFYQRRRDGRQVFHNVRDMPG
ncbi:MAG: hypothetical protein ALMCE001_19720 [Methanocorpusculum sp. MCE]|nr:MAG: hypothetical protein ALMCE001_19720 [Methanocorpusculum sp. MCE]